MRLVKARSLRGPADPPAETNASAASGADLSASHLFSILWDALADILGTAATATVVRRAAQRATPRAPELAALSVTRENLEYRFAVPDAWKDAACGPPQALHDLVREIFALLVELTGTVVISRLANLPELRDLGLFPHREE